MAARDSLRARIGYRRESTSLVRHAGAQLMYSREAQFVQTLTVPPGLFLLGWNKML